MVDTHRFILYYIGVESGKDRTDTMMLGHAVKQSVAALNGVKLKHLADTQGHVDLFPT